MMREIKPTRFPDYNRALDVACFDPSSFGFCEDNGELPIFTKWRFPLGKGELKDLLANLSQSGDVTEVPIDGLDTLIKRHTSLYAHHFTKADVLVRLAPRTYLMTELNRMGMGVNYHGATVYSTTKHFKIIKFNKPFDFQRLFTGNRK